VEVLSGASTFLKGGEGNMNQNMKVVNLTKGIVALDNKHVILPEKEVTLTVLEYPSILGKMNLLKQMGWVDWKFVPVDYENKEVSVQEIKQNETSNEELNDVSAVSPVLTAIE
jgi:selenocysteine lyase/cysteine desulfurase